jgi:hypothetical protein
LVILEYTLTSLEAPQADAAVEIEIWSEEVDMKGECKDESKKKDKLLGRSSFILVTLQAHGNRERKEHVIIGVDGELKGTVDLDVTFIPN